MDKKTVTWIVVVIVLIVLAYYLITTFTGEAIVGGLDPSCRDTDNGQNYFVKGDVTDETGKVYTDECEALGTLREYYCLGDRVSSVKKSCDCQEATCVRGR